MTDTARFIASPLGRAAIASVLALGLLSGYTMTMRVPLHGRTPVPVVIASPAAITGELA